MSTTTRISRRLRWMVIASSLLLAGCATQNCNILSTSHSFGCNAMYAALIVPAIPVALVSSAAETHRDHVRLSETWRLLQANDPPTVAHCVLGCDLPEKVKREQQDAFYERNVEQVIAWWGEHPEPAQLPILMKAYTYKGARRMKDDPLQAEMYLRKAAALSADPRMAKALESSEFHADAYNENYYDDLVERIQAGLITLRYRGVPGRDPRPQVLQDRCQAVAAWPSAWMTTGAKYKLELACDFAYSSVFGKVAPMGQPGVVDGVLDPVEPTARSE